MTNLPSLDQLKQAIALKEQVTALETQLNAILGGGTLPSFTPVSASHRIASLAGSKMSPETRARIAAAQKARWAKFRESKGAVPRTTPAKQRNFSPEARARLAAVTEQKLSGIHDAIDAGHLKKARSEITTMEKALGLFPELQEMKSMLDRFEMLKEG